MLRTTPTRRNRTPTEKSQFDLETRRSEGRRLPNRVGIRDSTGNSDHPETAQPYQVVFLSCIHFARSYMLIATARISCACLVISVARTL
jgi:hypothetical protein